MVSRSGPGRTRTAGARRAATSPDSSRAGTAAVTAVSGLIKRYGEFTAVNGIDLTVYDGEIFGIPGPKGAGETTTPEMIEGLREPDGGTIHVAGIDVARSERCQAGDWRPARVDAAVRLLVGA